MQNNNFKNRLFSYFYYFYPAIVMYDADIKVMNTCTENCVLFIDNDSRSDLGGKKFFVSKIISV